jgi:hypothetical protein
MRIITFHQQVVGLEEKYDLTDGWRLIGREDKKDRFTLVKGADDDPIDQVLVCNVVVGFTALQSESELSPMKL